jgi:Spy/CpxP family protein refolding chaperone
MKMNKTGWLAIAAAGSLLAFSSGLRAAEGQDAKKSEGGAGNRGAAMQERLDKMSEELKLTDEQKGKVKEAYKAQFEKMRGLRDASPEERREKGKAMMDEQDKKMKEILKPDQYEKWQKMQGELRGKMQQRGQGRRGGGSGKTQ